MSVEDITTWPFDADVTVTFVPAAMYDVPPTRRVNDPLKPRDAVTTPEEYRFGTLTSPVNVEPEMVATIESLISSVTSPDVPPPVSPVPAVTAVISPTSGALIVMAPLDAEANVTPIPAIRYEVPSTSRVRDPLRPNEAVTIPEE